MKHNLENIPEVSIDKVDAFYVTGTQHRDAVGNANNLKLNLKTLGGGGADIETLVNSEDFVAGVFDVIGNADKGLYVSAGASSPDETEILDYNLPLTQVKLARLLNFGQSNKNSFPVEVRYTYTGEGPIPDGFSTEPEMTMLRLYYDHDKNATPYIQLVDDKYYTWKDNNTLIEYHPMTA